jgi:hypothetical protein
MRRSVIVGPSAALRQFVVGVSQAVGLLRESPQAQSRALRGNLQVAEHITGQPV